MTKHSFHLGGGAGPVQKRKNPLVLHTKPQMGAR